MKDKALVLSADFSLPVEATTQAIGVIGKRRAGKSYTTAKFVEGLYHAGQQVVIIDPKGDWWGIRSSASGDQPGLPILILGGAHGDLPLEISAGEEIARFVVEERVSVLLDLSDMRKGQVAQFMATFLETLYRLKARDEYRTALMLVIDEADAIAPQRPMPGEQRMLGAAEDIVRRGGQRGIGCTMATQRAAVLNKNVLTQIQVLITLRTIAPQDLAAINDWVDVHGTQEQRRELMASLPALPVGTAWVWSPGWPTDEGIFQRVKVAPRQTYDSSATPKPGEHRSQPRTLADVDLPALRDRLATTVARAEENDPKVLRAKIAVLLNELGNKQPHTIVKEVVKRVEVPAIPLEVLYAYQRLRNGLDAMERLHAELRAGQEDLGKSIGAVIEGQSKETLGPSHDEVWVDEAANIDAETHNKVAKALNIAPNAPISPPHENGTSHGAMLGKGARGLLDVLVARHPMRVSRRQLATLAGRGFKSSSFSAQIHQLKAEGLVADEGGLLAATPSALDKYAYDYGSERPAPDSALEIWRRALPDGPRKMLAHLVSIYPDGCTRDELATATGFSPTSSSVGVHLGTLRNNGLAEVHGGQVRASDTLFNRNGGVT